MRDHSARLDRRAHREYRDHRLVSRTASPGGHDDDTSACELTGVRDRARGRREDRLARSAEQVDAAVAREPRFGRQFEAADDLGSRL
jgi:hypothetical protein